jgi:hypothetical protein
MSKQRLNETQRSRLELVVREEAEAIARRRVAREALIKELRKLRPHSTLNEVAELTFFSHQRIDQLLREELGPSPVTRHVPRNALARKGAS